MSSYDHTDLDVKRMPNCDARITQGDGCKRCADLEELLRQAEAAIVETGEQLAGREIQLRRAGAAEVALRRELNQVREEDPKGDDIRQVLDAWKRLLGHKKAKVPLTGKRADHVRKALRHHSADELIEALKGLALLPYVGNKGRKATGTDRERYDDIEYAMRDEITVAKMRGHYQRAQEHASNDSVLHAFWRIEALYRAYWDLVFDRLVQIERAGWTADDWDADKRRRDRLAEQASIAADVAGRLPLREAA